MAPATRTSGNFGSNHSSNLDHILDNFNQFKRKHITQNRDIIKTNALAQLRIKELEEKVLQLEGERAEKTLEVIRIRANMDRVERATRSLVRGWELVGAGLSAMAAIDGLQVAAQSGRGDLEVREILNATQIKQSNRIVLDPHALPGGVARNVSKAPEILLDNLIEESSRELREDDSEEGISTIEVEETVILLEETTTASQGDDCTIVQEAHIDEINEYNQRAGNICHDDCKASTSTVQDHLSIRSETSRLQRAASAESLSSFADDEEVQLSDDMDGEGDEDILQSILQDQKIAAMQEQRPIKSRRKREPTLSPDISETISPSQESSDGEITLGSRSSRRSSARDRKSINYALPKLNTKMRKPDPGDLIPAQGGEERRSDSSKEGGEEEEENREATPKRTLKGGSKVASTGNLRDIRKRHQFSRVNAEEDGQEHNVQSARRRRSSSGPQGRNSTSMDDHSVDIEGQTRGEELYDEEMTDLSSSWLDATPSTGWKPPSTLLGSCKSAATGTPIPRNQSGQNIKALKVANRIQKTTVNQPAFNGDTRKVISSRPFVPLTTGKILTSSTRFNQPKIATPIHEKRNSLHAAMTWEGQDEGNSFGAS